MTTTKKITSALLATLLVAGYSLPVYAEGDDTTTDTESSASVTKDESVYTVLNADGSIKSITVSDTLHSDSGFSNYDDASDLTDVENLKSTDAVTSSSDGYTWTSDSTDIYYQGSSTKELPLDVKITYTLNDKEYSASDIVGKSGHVKIKISVTNSSKQTYTVGDKSYELVTPFITGIGAMLDEDNFSNVEVNHGGVTSDSSHSIVGGVMIPGLKDGLESVLDGETMSQISDYLFDDITIEADTTNFESPTLMIAAATSADELETDFEDTDFTTIFDQLDELKEATNKLISGASTLSDGANTLASGASQLNDGASSLLSGVDTLKSGTQSLTDGASTATSGASALTSGLGTLVSNNETLVSGANQIADAILSTANTQLAANETIKNDPNYAELTWSNYADQLAYYAGITDTMRQAALDQIKAQLTAKGVELSDEELNMVLYMAAKDNATDLATYLTNKQDKLTTAKKVEAAQTDAALISSGDFSKVDRALTLATYEGAIGNIQSTVQNATRTDDNPNGTLLTTRQAEEVLKSVKGDTTQITTSVIADALKVTDITVLGVDDSTISQYVAGIRNATGDANVYASLSASLKQKNSSLTDTEIAVLVTEGSEYHNVATSLNAMISAVQADVSVATAINSYKEASQTDEGNQTIKGYLNALVTTTSGDNIETIKSLSTQLQSVATFRQGVKDYTDGVASAYEGSKTLLAGLEQLTSGSQQLNDGAAQLAQGASTLKDGTQSLTDGANQLSDGAKTLYDGLVQYNDEAISKLTENSRISTLEDAADLLTAVKEQGSAYNNYSGISEGTDGSVKFVYKVEGAKATTSTTTEEDTTETKTSFWQKIVNLFDFSSLFNND
jgi:putative membrane protein